MSSDILLDFKDVSLAVHPPYELGLESVSFRLRAGELMLVTVPKGHGHSPLADVAEGLVLPEAGSVRFGGNDWAETAPEAAALLRGHIGRVFDQPGWLSNLDVNENITLSQRHHTERPAPEIEQEAEALARGFGLPGLPRVRPALLRRSDLRRAEWVRALLGRPWLVLLEQPMRDVYAAALTSLLDALDRARDAGAAVMFMTVSEDVPPSVEPRISRWFNAEGSRLVPR